MHLSLPIYVDTASAMTSRRWSAGVVVAVLSPLVEVDSRQIVARSSGVALALVVRHQAVHRLPVVGSETSTTTAAAVDSPLFLSRTVDNLSSTPFEC